MFLETSLNSPNTGRIEIICGSMFSGKTEELIKRIKRCLIAKQKVIIFKPKIDNRYSETEIVSHDNRTIKSISLKKSTDIYKYDIHNYDVIGIDEVQFFDDKIFDIVQELADSGIRIIASGLDMDYSRKPFGIMPKLIAIAEQVTKAQAICTDCGELASYSFRIDKIEDTILLGEKDKYKALCRRCYLKNNENKS